MGLLGYFNVVGVVLVFLVVVGDGDYDGVLSEGRGGLMNEVYSMDESNFGVGEMYVWLGFLMYVFLVLDFCYVFVMY